MVTPEEQQQIQERMAQMGILNMGAYMRKMALNGYVLQVDLSPVRELVSLQRRCAPSWACSPASFICREIGNFFRLRSAARCRSTLSARLANCSGVTKPGPYKYYSTQRPIDIGTYPQSYFNKPIHMTIYVGREQVEGEDSLDFCPC